MLPGTGTGRITRIRTRHGKPIKLKIHWVTPAAISAEMEGLYPVSCNISNKRDSVSSGYPNTEETVEKTTRSGVFLTKFEMFG